MNIQAIYINLPIDNVEKTKEFWQHLGFQFNQQFSDEKALCLVLKEDLIYSMMIQKEQFATFTNRKIADQTTTQVLNAIQVDSKEKVDELIKLALEKGATKYKEPVDHGWMYYDTFADINGHQWEIMYFNQNFQQQ